MSDYIDFAIYGHRLEFSRCPYNLFRLLFNAEEMKTRNFGIGTPLVFLTVAVTLVNTLLYLFCGSVENDKNGDSMFNFNDSSYI
ncbi:hypothetical protein XNC1_4530 [Xenorhabdus nematophila ATCC 19061]|uniref:Uncharacterized protein n=1 Tax=Xenorhabdus nematophila (strain ATCC 19061 / DSM 3370 / CCUG 14189 / LMG 1036 / NCIMB 9965 / AN6) TaxID=406817 RepID=D3VF95_XENNA|nr:hypothetical protein [Xenorhabdus nematophila]CBJ92552.1 hypothetical protein XNC1_4530 [Xenorhabdus nematophila ATCC 19061]